MMLLLVLLLLWRPGLTIVTVECYHTALQPSDSLTKCSIVNLEGGNNTCINSYNISIIVPVKLQDNAISLAPDRYFYDARLLRYNFSKLWETGVNSRVQYSISPNEQNHSG